MSRARPAGCAAQYYREHLLFHFTDRKAFLSTALYNYMFSIQSSSDARLRYVRLMRPPGWGLGKLLNAAGCAHLSPY